MINITHKSSSLRKAIATAIVKVSSVDTINAIKNNTVPKGNVLESARVAALFAAKKTSEVIPDCHPMPVEYTAIRFDIKGLEITIEAEVHTVYKTGVEVEAMYAASVAALTIYDMLKPVDKQIEISTIKLLHKSGGKSDVKVKSDVTYTAAVMVCSDSVAAGKKEDQAGKAIIERLKKFNIESTSIEIIPDEIEKIQQKIKAAIDQGVQIILITGGTGLSKRDVTPEAVLPLIETEIPGIVETARQFGQQRTPYAMLSRGVAGFIKDTLVITLPGSVNGVNETIDALFPQVLHVLAVRKENEGWNLHNQ
ncbi:MAG TPA: bifunctional molybdenum cofactor biosynthesis protein MoaC/MoaB [Saprospiraceae bacterium]|nr:bifunctional molybdenum cofactor biosynthesis protein MoaC/MoaB [Saprospiraceae bacterium]